MRTILNRLADAERRASTARQAPRGCRCHKQGFYIVYNNLTEEEAKEKYPDNSPNCPRCGGVRTRVFLDIGDKWG